MARKRINACWLLLLVLMYTAGLLLGVGESQARYNNTVAASTLVQSRQIGVTSNCLVTSKDAPVTVLAGEMSLYSPMSLSFWLQSTGAEATGKLRWGVKDPESAKFVKVTMQSGSDMIEPEAEIDLLEDVRMDITMNITPTEKARNTVHEEIKIQVLVTWGESMWGTFQMILPEVKPEPTEPETEPTEPETEPTEPETEPTEPETAPTDPTTEVTEPSTEATEPTTGATEPTTGATEPTTGATEPTTGATEPTSGVTEPTTGATEPTSGVTEPSTEATEPTSGVTEPSTEVTEPSTEATEPTTGATEPSTEVTEPSTEVTEPSTEATEPSTEVTEPSTEVTEPSTEATEPSTEATEPSTEATEPSTEATEPSTEETEPATEETEFTIPPEFFDDEEKEKNPIRLETLNRFDITQKLPVRIYMTEEVTSVRLGINELDAIITEDPLMPWVEVKPLPAFTRFSLDGGESYYMLYHGAVAEFAAEGFSTVDLLLDFGYTGMEYGTGFLLAMDAVAGDQLLENSFDMTICSSAQLVKPAVYEKDIYLQSLKTVRTDLTEEEENTLPKNSTGYILNQDTALVLDLPKEWQETQLEYTVELLSRAEDDTLYYKRIDPEASGLHVRFHDDEQRYELAFTLEDRLPQAGTYRVNMQWTYEDICYAKKQITFFINYAAHTEYSLGSLEVPNND